LIARSPACRDLVRHPLVLAVAGGLLSRASTYQLHLTQLITVLPGEADQPMHRDQDCDGYPFPPDYDIACNTLWALTDFTAANGATRVLPGTHLLAPDTTAEEAQEGRAVERAEMARGSVLLYTAKVWHGGGANHTGSPRQAVNLTYSVGWVRQEENQYLSTPLEVARTLDDDLLKLMGYQLGGPAIGYVRDFEDPMVVVRNRPKQALTFGHVS
jgi:ectoine hydroxylase-related dioxygenase (phytanoyl-CoA dioxygenase family)